MIARIPWFTAHVVDCRGVCYNNAVIESFCSTLKSDLGRTFESCGQAETESFGHIEVFHNHRRRHSTRRQISPAEFERKMAA